MFFENHLNPSCWYSLDSSHCILSEEYPCARVSIIFSVLLHYFVLAKLATNSLRVKAIFKILSLNWIFLPTYEFSLLLSARVQLFRMRI